MAAMKPEKTDTLNDVHVFIKNNWEEGCDCPACGRRVKLYRRKFNSSMAHALIILYNLHKKEGFQKYFKMNDVIANLKIPANNIEYAKLHYWGLAIQSPTSRKTDTISNGYWKITKKGFDFAKALTTIPLYVFVYNTSVQGFSESQISIKDALSKKFNYNKLIK